MLSQKSDQFVVKVYDTRTKHYFLREKLHSVGSVIPIPERDPPETGARGDGPDARKLFSSGTHQQQEQCRNDWQIEVRKPPAILFNFDKCKEETGRRQKFGRATFRTELGSF
ncbi:hypothetical protein GEV33_002560 [Tenebrio molitor]|uniref:Uncharacterized protein n=1 Tax=Tenebrio molitor TaxID=7067 RepID=A0A8J6HRB0_TENMO|nr:hypothetical protein GEV33_002560 [Tenebrio molitor]